MQKSKKAKFYIAVFLLVISLFVGMIPANASFAAVVADGTFGEDNNLTWVLDNTGLLSISGKGKMQDMYVQDYPWYSYADQITAVKIQNGVQNVGTYMFEEYDNLETVEIGESVLVIGKYSFNFCDNLRSVTIPKSLRRVDEQAFFMCPLLSDVHIADASLWCGLEFMSAHANPLYNGADLLFDGKIVTEITAPDFVTEIGNYQFYGCQSLEKIKLHADVTVIGTAAFANCPSLRAIYCEKADDQIHKILDTNSELDKELFVGSPDEQDKITDGDVIEKDGVLYSADMTVLRGFTEAVAAELVVPETVTGIADGAFRNCFALQNITLPDGITELPDLLFENCRNLQNVTFSDKLTAIGNRVFSGCIRLEEIILPATVSDIGEYAFSSCRELHSMTLPKAVTALADGVFADCARMEEINLPEALQTVGNNAFYNCYNLKEITLPKTVTKLGTSAFYGCAALTAMTLPDGITELPEQIFYGCYNLTDVVLPSALTGIGRYAFYDCIALRDLQLPDTLMKIGEYAFFGCESLTEIVIPPAVTQLEDSSFKACLFLAKITLPEGLQLIGNEAFRYCQTLDALYIPATITSLDESAFDQCYYLKKIYFGGNKEQWIQAYPDGIPKNIEVVFEHTHTAGKWDVTACPGPETEGIAQRNCEQCHALQTAKMEKTAFPGNETATVNMDGFLSVVAEIPSADLLHQAGDGAVLTDKDGNAVAEDVFVGTGMVLTLADGTNYTVVVPGDCDGNGIINAEDARLTLRLSVNLEDFVPDSVQYKACDVDDFTGVTASDARSILRASVGLDDPKEWKR
ncbi:MAG: leucine-rich repeat protein [Clostridia bacterium]|nr:leucine-rich repeat protein [Clostridia bacterium]